MSWQVLARKWRPRNFNEVVGQEHVLSALVNGLLLRRIHHVCLFSGTRGVGKTSIARLLAKGLNCENEITAFPCGKCRNCCEIEEGRSVDLIEVDAASRTKVEDTRELLENVQYTPVYSRFKVYIIDEVHMLSRHSFNALLKTLEEPPLHAKFLLATTDSQKLPVTILSRCLQFHLKSLSIDQIFHHLERVLNEEGIEYDFNALRLLSRAADGSLRDALTLADQAINSGAGRITEKIVKVMLSTLDDTQAILLLECIVSSNCEKAMTLVDEVFSLGIEWEALLIEMQALLHRIAMAQIVSSLLNKAEENTVEYRLYKLARTIHPSDVHSYYQIILTGRKELSFAPSKRIGVEMTLLRALLFRSKKIFLESNNDVS